LPDYPVKRSRFNPLLGYPRYIALTEHSIPRYSDRNQTTLAQATHGSPTNKCISIHFFRSFALAYRETEHTLAKKAYTRLRLLKTARRLVQQGGFAAASASAVAKESGGASGTIYRHLPNKSELVAEVFRYATERCYYRG
jgi:hypothetical protein